MIFQTRSKFIQNFHQ
ncbi:hypothetical protein [Anaerobutyricum hallii]